VNPSFKHVRMEDMDLLQSVARDMFDDEVDFGFARLFCRIRATSWSRWTARAQLVRSVPWGTSILTRRLISSSTISGFQLAGSGAGLRGG
jgi:hypothetical protein